MIYGYGGKIALTTAQATPTVQHGTNSRLCADECTMCARRRQQNNITFSLQNAKESLEVLAQKGPVRM
jgi:hypothetical protein